MKLLTTKFKRVIKCKVLANNGEIKIKFPRQLIGNIALEFENDTKKIILKQWEIFLNGDTLDVQKVK